MAEFLHHPRLLDLVPELLKASAACLCSQTTELPHPSLVMSQNDHQTALAGHTHQPLITVTWMLDPIQLNLVKILCNFLITMSVPSFRPSMKDTNLVVPSFRDQSGNNPCMNLRLQLVFILEQGWGV
jgi:hypothetical protein